MPKIKIWKNNKGEFYFTLKAENGETIVWSEGYSSRQGAVNAAIWVKSNALFASIE